MKNESTQSALFLTVVAATTNCLPWTMAFDRSLGEAVTCEELLDWYHDGNEFEASMKPCSCSIETARSGTNLLFLNCSNYEYCPSCHPETQVCGEYQYFGQFAMDGEPDCSEYCVQYISCRDELTCISFSEDDGFEGECVATIDGRECQACEYKICNKDAPAGLQNALPIVDCRNLEQEGVKGATVTDVCAEDVDPTDPLFFLFPPHHYPYFELCLDPLANATARLWNDPNHVRSRHVVSWNSGSNKDNTQCERPPKDMTATCSNGGAISIVHLDEASKNENEKGVDCHRIREDTVQCFDNKSGWATAHFRCLGRPGEHQVDLKISTDSSTVRCNDMLSTIVGGICANFGGTAYTSVQLGRVCGEPRTIEYVYHDCLEESNLSRIFSSTGNAYCQSSSHCSSEQCHIISQLRPMGDDFCDVEVRPVVVSDVDDRLQCTYDAAAQPIGYTRSESEDNADDNLISGSKGISSSYHVWRLGAQTLFCFLFMCS